MIPSVSWEFVTSVCLQPGVWQTGQEKKTGSKRAVAQILTLAPRDRQEGSEILQRAEWRDRETRK
jgi:hypothetical protein